METKSISFKKDTIPYMLRKSVVEDEWKKTGKEKRQTKHLDAFNVNKKKLEMFRTKLCLLLKSSLDINDLFALSKFKLEFLEELLEDTKKVEKNEKIHVLGKQEYVDMCTEAVTCNKASTEHQSEAIEKLKNAMNRLQQVVLERETIFSCIEINMCNCNKYMISSNLIDLDDVLKYKKIKCLIEKDYNAVRKND